MAQRGTPDGGARLLSCADLVTYDQIAQFGRTHKFPEASLQKLQEVLYRGKGAIETALRAEKL
jgi:hypothetical protein